MKIDYIEFYTDYLIRNNGKATGLSAMTDNEMSHDQITRFLSKNEFVWFQSYGKKLKRR